MDQNLEPVSKSELVEKACEQDVELMEKFIDSGLSHEEFFDKFMASPALKEGEESSDEESKNDEAPATEEESSEAPASESTKDESASQNEASSEEVTGCFEVLKRFYVRMPAANGDIEKRIVEVGEKIPAEFISEEVISLKLVKKV